MCQEGLGLGEQLFAATAATKEAMAGDLKGISGGVLRVRISWTA